MYVIGTAGHVDHGKSTLVHALTGIDPDRLREEKERGLTIDLGFAWLTLPSGREVSIVDVPGHERFIKNMLAGAGGVDLALLVVAADEGPMPQTREHLAILDLLDVPSGVVAITKCDLVEPEYVDLVQAELEEVLAGSRLAGAPMVRVSAATGEGLTELAAVLDAALERTPAKRDLGRPRLPIDRAFTIQGFGVVVTGTLVDGALEVGREMELQPGRLKVRIRGLQRHKTKVDRLEPGTRAAVNLSGIHAEDVRRGMVLALPGTLARVTVVDAHVRAASTLSHPLAHDAGVTFLCATSEAEGKIRLLDADDLDPGGEAWVQIVLESPVAVVRGDRCVIRTPNETVAGGVIVAVNPRRHRRHHALTIARLAQELEGSAVDRLADRLVAGPLTPGSVAPALGLEAAEADDAVREAVRGGLAVARGERLFGQLWLDSTAARIAGTARAFVAANPLRGAAPREHVRSTTTLSVADFEVAVSHAVEQGLIEERGREGIAPAGHRVTLSASQRGAADRFLASLRAGGFSPPTEGLAEPALLAYLADEGMVENTGAGVVFAAEVFAEMLEKTSEYITTHGGISLGEVRDLFGTSRKYAQAFLEHLDARRITRRVGDTRVLRAPVEAVQ